LVACQDCGLGFADRIPEQSVFDRHYAEMSKYEYGHRAGGESPFDAARFEQIAAYLASQIPDRATRVLDVGCATGGQLARLRVLGYENLMGLDPSPTCSRLAREFHGIEVRVGTLFSHDLPANAFDLIILVGVLEHVRDVAEAVQKLSPCLSSNGLIFAEVPDATAFADWPDAPYQELSIEHINFFGPRSLENLMRASGYVMVSMDRPPRQFTETTVMPSAAGLFQRAPERLPLLPDTDSAPRLLDYIRQSAAEEKRVAGLIDKLVEQGQPLAVWGVGTHTLHLMETTNLGNARITAFVDVNTKYHGKNLFDRPVISPEAMRNRSEPVLISSRAFQNDIAEMIQQELELPNQLILLYEEMST
jgi:SAM-dependent methyltransferase